MRKGLRYNEKTGQWIIDKVLRGLGRIYERTGYGKAQRPEAEERLLQLIHEARTNERRKKDNIHSFREAATRYLTDYEGKRSIGRDADCLAHLDRHIGTMNLESVHMGVLDSYIKARRGDGIKSSTIRRELAVARRILSLSSRVWRHNDGTPWLKHAPPIIEMPDWEDRAQPYPLSAVEQVELFRHLPDYMARMALFGVNTGCREQGICWMRWDWEIKIPELSTSVFVLPGRRRQYADDVWSGTKNKTNGLIVLNSVAKSIIDEQRGKHPDYVFPFEGRKIHRMNNTGWKKAWKDAGLPVSGDILRGPHNLRHTFAARLRAAGVPLEVRKTLMHHVSRDVTEHYSPAQIAELIEAVERIVDQGRGQTLLRIVI